MAYLPNVLLPGSIRVTPQLGDTAETEALLVAVPAQSLRATLLQLKPVISGPKPVVLCVKGIERLSGLLMTEVVAECLSAAIPLVLSGPSFAMDVASGLPTAVAIAGPEIQVRRLQATLGSEAFRPYGSDDIAGVALGGAIKNVYAIAAGIAAGLGLGESARAALLARSFAELVRFGEMLGAKRDTLMGLSGLGDLVLTATSTTSRNYAFGLAVGRGARPAELKGPGHPLTEGVDTAPALVKRAREVGVELPIAQATAAVLEGSLTAAGAIVALMSRPLTSE
jgi:glycerol-3-phosphate dehydrogenase (NAD(P)+)